MIRAGFRSVATCVHARLLEADTEGIDQICANVDVPAARRKVQCGTVYRGGYVMSMRLGLASAGMAAYVTDGV